MTNTGTLTQREALDQARADYEAALGTEIRPALIMGYVGSNSVEIATNGTIVVRVVETDLDAVAVTNDNFVDPYWDVALVSDPNGLLNNVRSIWIDGPSIQFTK